MEWQDVHPRQFELIWSVGVRRAASAAPAGAGDHGIGGDIAVRIDQEIRRHVDADVFDPVLRGGVTGEHLPAVRESFGHRDLQALVALENPGIVGDHRAVGR